MPFPADLPFAFYAVVAFVFGLMVGSFLNVVIWRVPRGESIAFPGSHCGSCDAPVKPYDNIPLISYAVLGGKCRACKAKISLIYPAVELLTGLLFLAVVWESGPTWVAIAEMIFVALMVSLTFIDAKHKLLPNVITYPAFLFGITAVTTLAWWSVLIGTKPRDPAYHRFYGFQPEIDFAFFRPSVYGALLLALAAPVFWVIDRLDDVLFGKYFEWTEDEKIEDEPPDLEKERAAQRQHDRVVYGTMILGVVLAIAWAIKGYLLSTRGATGIADIEGDAYDLAYSNLLRAWLGALVGGGIIWLLRAAYFYVRGFEGMGLGDVKLMAVIGAFLGWQSAILVILVGSLLGSIIGVVLARKSDEGMKTALPYGVFLGPAAVFALFFGNSLVQWYASKAFH
ncbi:MAG TPA: prepilin peptidase [Blastocatellia bacterium]|nr:prepilin peptidase [Blastocatellia bacterium]